MDAVRAKMLSATNHVKYEKKYEKQELKMIKKSINEKIKLGDNQLTIKYCTLRESTIKWLQDNKYQIEHVQTDTKISW